MAVKIRGNQIADGTLPASAFVSSLNLATSQLADGANFIKRDGTVAMTAALNLGSQKITNLLDPTALQDGATKNYVDTRETAIRTDMFRKDGTVTATGAFNMGNFKITGLAEPTASSDAATKNYVDLAVQGLAPKAAVRVGTTANITLSGTQTIDGVALSAGDRVLVKDQTTAADNGIYVAAAGAWTRATDADTGAEIRGAYVFIQEGTALADTGWVISTNGTPVLGTNPIAFVQFTSAGTISAGNGLTKVGNTLSVLLDTNSGLTVSGSGVKAAFSGSTIIADATGLKLNTAAGSTLAAGTVLLGNGSGVATATALSGDISVSNTGVVTVSALKAANVVTGEVPTGAINGVNAAFTLSATPLANSEQVFYNGIRLIRGAGEDYTISGTTITMISYIPVAGDKLVVDYIK